MQKIIKGFIICAMMITFGIIGVFVVESKTEVVQEVNDQKQLVEHTPKIVSADDQLLYEDSRLIGIHIALGEVLGKATLSNGGILGADEDQRGHVRKKNLDFYPDEIKKVIEIINRSIYKSGK